MKRHGFWMGIGIGLIIIIPITALMALASVVLKVDFLPFNLFDWLARVLPGNVITFGIDQMVRVISLFNLGATDSVAKLAEQVMSIVGFIGLNALIGGLFFLLAKRVPSIQRHAVVAGMILGVLCATLTLMVATNTPQYGQVNYLLSILVQGILMFVFGLILGIFYRTLDSLETTLRPESRTFEAYNRRQFLIGTGTGAAVITLVGAGLSTLIARNISSDSGVPTPMPTGLVGSETSVPTQVAELPNADDPLVPAPGTRPEYTPLDQHYRIDINLIPPFVAEEGYTLPFVTSIVSGDGTQTTLAQLTLDQIRNDFEAVSDYITMACISNPIGGDLISTTLWTGARMRDILESVGIPEGATHLFISAADGFFEAVSIEEIMSDERIILCYAWDQQPLTTEHGFPLRIHLPNRFGMKQPKWITQIEFVAGDRDGYWVVRGWDKEAIAVSASVIDTIAIDAAYENEQGQWFIPIGGMAWAGDRGISDVQIRVDDGEWVSAQLRTPLSERAWTIWRYDWPYTEGNHRFTVRCREGDGDAQPEFRANPHPAGAAGLYAVDRAIPAFNA